MSGAARRRGGRGRAGTGAGAGADVPSDTSSRRSRGTDRLRPPPGAFDGPASRGSASGAGSQGSRGSSNPPSVQPSGARSPSGTRSPTGPPAVAPLQSSSPPSSRQGSVSSSPTSAPQRKGDPAKDPQKPVRDTDIARNIDLPASFYNIDNHALFPDNDSKTEFKARPGFNTSGKSVQLALNSYNVTRFPTVPVYQYDVIIGSGAEHRGLLRKMWESKARLEKTGRQIIWDGNKLAWSSRKLPQISIMVDLDLEEGRPKGREANTHRLLIRPVKVLDLSIIHSYLDGRIQYNNTVLESMSFLDHMIREWASSNERFTKVKRSFFIRDGQRQNLGKGVEVFRGVYQSLRLAEGQKLIVNLDVANTCFYVPTTLTGAIQAKYELKDPQHIAFHCKPVQKNGDRHPSPMQKEFQKAFRRVHVAAVYKGNPAPNKDWVIDSIMLQNSMEYMIEWKNLQTRVVEGRVSIFDYFKRKYNITLQYPQLPLIQMTKKNVQFPMELLHIKPSQRYPFKLDEGQTANMIKFAVSPPSVRERAIGEGKGWLSWGSDPVLKEFNMKIEEVSLKTQARLLPAPGVKFGNKVEQPGTRGRWDLRGKRFLSGNPTELVSWGIGWWEGPRSRMDRASVDAFVKSFTAAYRGHGGRVSNQPPFMGKLPADAGEAVEALHQQTGNLFKRRPQLMIFIVPDKNSFFYTRIKKSCDCRYGVVSQVMQAQQVLKMNGQYFSNVLMKVNAKLGGCTSQAISAPASGCKPWTVPTMIIGADVSHPSPGSPQASMAAMTVSFDRHAGRYAAACQTNGHRVEMITDENVRNMLGPLLDQWKKSAGGGSMPQQVYYIRDGVSEGEFVHVMKSEVPAIRDILGKVSGKGWTGKMTVIIASKRHHIRAFPQMGGEAADNKGNPLPGILVERDCTSPFEWDFFLYSHIALQGTSRPVHYTILADEANHPPNFIQNMIYEHCYQYMRSTTSVSLHPAVYYAHLASNRAKAHEDIPASQGPQGGPGYKQNIRAESSEDKESETRPLMPMFNTNGIIWAMWYI